MVDCCCFAGRITDPTKRRTALKYRRQLEHDHQSIAVDNTDFVDELTPNHLIVFFGFLSAVKTPNCNRNVSRGSVIHRGTALGMT